MRKCTTTSVLVLARPSATRDLVTISRRDASHVVISRRDEISGPELVVLLLVLDADGGWRRIVAPRTDLRRPRRRQPCAVRSGGDTRHHLVRVGGLGLGLGLGLGV